MRKSLKHKIGGFGCSLLLLTPTMTPIIVHADPGYADGYGYGWDDATDLTNDMAQDNIQSQQAETINDSIEMQYTMNENMIDSNEFQSAFIETSTEVQQELNTLQNEMTDSNTIIDNTSNNPDLAVDALQNSDSVTEALDTANKENADTAQSKSDENEQKCKKDLDSLGTRILNALDASSLSEAWANLNGEELDRSDKDKDSKSMIGALCSLFGVDADWANSRSLLCSSPSYDEEGRRIRENYTDEGKDSTFQGGSNLSQALTETDLASFVLDLTGHDRYQSRDKMNNWEQAFRYGDNLAKFAANLVGKGEVSKDSSKLEYLAKGYTLADYYNDKKTGEYTHDNLNGGGKSNESKGDGNASK